MTSGAVRAHGSKKHMVIPGDKLHAGEIREAKARGIDVETPVHRDKLARIKARIHGQAPAPASQSAYPPNIGPVLTPALSFTSVATVVASRPVAPYTAVSRREVRVGGIRRYEDDEDSYLPYPGEVLDTDLERPGAA